MGRAFVEWMAERREEAAARLRHAIRDMRDLLPPEASGQVRREASRFALIGEALELATDAGLTGWEAGEGKAAVTGCMAEWLDRYGLGNREDVLILEQMEGWFALHARGRFINWGGASSDSEPAMKDCAGYFRRLSGELQWLVFPSVFVNEIATGFDRSVAADVATKAGMLKRGGDGKATSMHRTPDHNTGRRFYCFTAITRQSSEATS